MNDNFELDEIIEMGGHIEINNPIMLFMADEGIEPINGTEYPEDNAFALVTVDRKSKLQLLNRKENGYFGIIVDAVNPIGLTEYEPEKGIDGVHTGALEAYEVNGHHFVTSWLDLKCALEEKRGPK